MSIDWSKVKTAEQKRQEQLDQLWTAIKAERDRRQSEGGFLVNGHWFHSDTKSRIQQMALKDSARDLIAAGGNETDPLTLGGQQIHWKLLDGSFVPMTAGLAIRIVDAAKQQEAALFQVAEQHWAGAKASNDPASYDYSTGWPEAFWERDA